MGDVFDNLEIVRFNGSSQEYNKLLAKYKSYKDLDIIKCQTFNSGKYIYLLIKKGFLGVKHIIGYSIILHYNELSKGIKDNVSVFQIPKEIYKDSCPNIIADFMITRTYKNKKIGKWFYNCLLQNYYSLETKFVLNAAGDGLYFWERVGYKSYDDTSTVKINY